MRAEFLKTKGTWREVGNSARTTINMENGDKEPSSMWKKRMIMAEHSPIRQISFKIKWYDLPYWVSVHFSRHFIGIIHWIRTQRSDRTGVDRDELPQGSFVEHEFEANTQAMIGISRKRLCNNASKKTKLAWIDALDVIKEEEPEIFECCVPECVYRGFCPEYKTCGYYKTDDYKNAIVKYRKGINDA